MMNTHMKNLLLASSITIATLSQGAVIDFDVASDFNNNYRESANSGTTLWTTGGYLTKTSNNAFTAVYNINDNGASAVNQASNTYDNPRTLIGGAAAVTLSADFQTSNLNSGNSFGFYVKIPDATGNTTPNGGYAVLFRLDDNGTTSGGNIDARFYDYSTNNKISDGTLNNPSSPASTQTIGAAVPINTWHTARLTFQDVGTNVVFIAAVFQGSTQIGSVGWTGTSAVLGSGQWGFRASTANSGTMLIDNVGIIPEPGTLALVGILLGTMVLLRRRR